MKPPKFDAYNPKKHDKYYKNLLNYDLADKNHKVSYFNLKDKYLNIEFPVYIDSFFVKNIFAYSIKGNRIILVHISNNTNDASRNLDKNFIMKIKEPIAEIKDCSGNDIITGNDDDILVFVFNDNSNLHCSHGPYVIDQLSKKSVNPNQFTKKVLEIFKPEMITGSKDNYDPLEGNDGGGVITRNP